MGFFKKLFNGINKIERIAESIGSEMAEVSRKNDEERARKEAETMIAVCKVDSSGSITGYDQNGFWLFNFSSSNGELVGWTATTVSLRDPYTKRVTVYDKHGHFMYSI